MFWVDAIFVFGFLALFLFILSVRSARNSAYKTGLLFAVLELMSGAVSSAAWAWALKVSGKTDWFLLGIRGYTLIGLIFWCMDGVGLICLAVCIVSLMKNRRAAIQA